MRMSRRMGLYARMQSGQPLSNLAIGSKLAITENSILVPFLVLKHDYESSGRSLLLREGIHSKRSWHTSSVNAYATSAINTWLNGTYLSSIDADIRTKIAAVNIPYTPGDGNNTVSSLNTQVFLLSYTETGLPQKTGANVRTNIEGTAISYFDSDTKRIAYYDGTATGWRTRSPNTKDTETVLGVGSGGSSGYTRARTSYGIRPAFTLPSSLLVSLEPDASGAYSIV